MRPLGVILTAGLGTRLQPLTPATPKPLVPLLNRPLIAYALDLMRTLGLSDVAVVVGPEDATTARYVREEAPDDLAVSVATPLSSQGLEPPTFPGRFRFAVQSSLANRAESVGVRSRRWEA